MAFIDNLLPAAEGSGFRMEGYYVWCGSPIKGEDGLYYLFASRWPVRTGFPTGYSNYSEIVLAATDRLEAPFRYVKTIISARSGGYWDSRMAHNPCIVKTSGHYVLFYIGSDDGLWEHRKIGYAVSDTINGDWRRSPRPIALPTNANNPAVYVEEDQSILMIFRDGELKVSAARAGKFDGEYVILNDDVSPGIKLEDPFIYKSNGRYEMLIEDADAGLTGYTAYGAHLVSEDGVNWRPNTPVLGYTHAIPLTNGIVVHADRRERPSLLFEDGCITALFTAVQVGDSTWNCVQPYAEK